MINDSCKILSFHLFSSFLIFFHSFLLIFHLFLFSPFSILFHPLPFITRPFFTQSLSFSVPPTIFTILLFLFLFIFSSHRIPFPFSLFSSLRHLVWKLRSSKGNRILFLLPPPPPFPLPLISLLGERSRSFDRHRMTIRKPTYTSQISTQFHARYHSATIIREDFNNFPEKKFRTLSLENNNLTRLISFHPS